MPRLRLRVGGTSAVGGRTDPYLLFIGGYCVLEFLAAPVVVFAATYFIYDVDACNWRQLMAISNCSE